MMNKDKKTTFITTLICFCSLIVSMIFSVFYPENKNTQLNSHSDALLLIGVLINIFLNIVLNFKVCKNMGAKFLVKLGKWIMPFTSLFLVVVSIYSTVYPNSSFSNSATIVFVGLLFIVSGNYFPKNHVNQYIGLKFPWLLNDEESWDKTHKLASYTWILAGILFILQLFISSIKTVSIPLVIILVGVLPLIYSLMLVYKNRRYKK
ncbi:SdpI family protein [Anaerocolumna sp. AGMB13020]|uniref:SdpI family protein n=1 Tax=Anaerocolumna sp. AGMB13020 TaxID=3081750 RepID=UPI0029556CFB|nr:SdpI family protein [Anaerocolumna sp. AGMB13020]WOO39115.1 SdpI family protein [Anaerocolumna sp. AGMB13020]